MQCLSNKQQSMGVDIIVSKCSHGANKEGSPAVMWPWAVTGRQGIILLRTKMVMKLGYRCHSVPSQDHTFLRFSKPDPVYQSDGYTEAQRGKATSPGPHSR